MAKFRKEVLDLMENDPDLFIKIKEALGIKPGSLPMTIRRNGNVLNQYTIVALVADHLGKNPEDLLEQETDEKHNTAA